MNTGAKIVGGLVLALDSLTMPAISQEMILPPSSPDENPAVSGSKQGTHWPTAAAGLLTGLTVGGLAVAVLVSSTTKEEKEGKKK